MNVIGQALLMLPNRPPLVPLYIDFSGPADGASIGTFYLADLGITFSPGLEKYVGAHGALGPSPDTPGYASNWAGSATCLITLPADRDVNSITFKAAYGPSSLQVSLTPRSGSVYTATFVTSGDWVWRTYTVTHDTKAPLASIRFTVSPSTGYYGVDTLDLTLVP